MARLHAVTGSQWRRTVRIAGRSASWYGVQSSSLLSHARTAADPHRCFSELAPDRQKSPLDGSREPEVSVVQLAIGQQPGIGGDRRAAKLKHQTMIYGKRFVVFWTIASRSTDQARGSGRYSVEARVPISRMVRSGGHWTCRLLSRRSGESPEAPGGSHDAQAKAVSWGADCSM